MLSQFFYSNPLFSGFGFNWPPVSISEVSQRTKQSRLYRVEKTPKIGQCILPLECQYKQF